MRIGDCVRCGGGIGRRGTELCHRCRAADREASRRSPCVRCGRVLRLRVDTARCGTCSRTCVDCDGIVRRKADTRCRHCRRRHDAAAAKQTCGRCGRLGLIREHTGWCGTCSRPRPEPRSPRPCTECARLTRRLSNGLCSRCWQRHPDRAINQAENLASVLDDPPWWVVPFAAYASERMSIGRVSVLVTGLKRLLSDGESPHPQAVLQRARTPGRSAGSLARTLEDFFIEHQLAFGLDQPARLAAGRRQRRVDATPEPLRGGVGLFCEHLIGSRQRALRAGTAPRADSTIEGNLANVRDFARFLVDERSKPDWSTVQPADIDAFLNTQPTNRRRRLSSLRQFFAWARKNRIVLVDPTKDLALTPQRGFTGDTLTISQQRRLFRRWTTDATVHPHEALVGLLALLHALSPHRTPPTARQRHRPRPPHDPRDRATTPAQPRPRQLRSDPTMPRPPPLAAHPEPAPDRDQGDPATTDPSIAGIHDPRPRPRRGQNQETAGNPARRTAPQPRRQTGRRGPRHERRRAPRLPSRRRRHRTPQQLEPVNIRPNLAHLRPNVCALAGCRLLDRAMERFSWAASTTQ